MNSQYMDNVESKKDIFSDECLVTDSDLHSFKSSEGLVDLAVKQRKIKARKKRKKKKNRERRQRKRDRQQSRTRREFDEPTAYFMDLSAKRLIERSMQMHTESSVYDKSYFDQYFSSIDSEFSLESSSAMSELIGCLSNDLPSSSVIFSHICRLVGLVHNLYMLNSTRARFVCFSAYIGGLADVIPVSEIQKLVADKLSISSFEDIPEEFFLYKEEVLDEKEDDDLHFESYTSSLFKAVMHSRTAKLLGEVALALTSFQLVGSNVSSSILRWMGNPRKYTLTSLVELFIKSCETVMRFGSALVAGASISDAWFSQEPEVAFIREVLEFLNEEIVYEGDNDYYMSARDFISKSKDMIKTGEYIKSVMSSRDKRYSQINDLIRELHRKSIRVEQNLAARSRHRPLAIVLSGAPSIGKSHIIKAIKHAWARANGYDPDKNLMYTRTIGSAFWEQYDPDLHPIIYYSELGNLSAAQSDKEGGQYLAELQRLIDTNPMPLNTAFGDKGSVYAHPKLVLIDTNIKGLWIERLTSAPAAHLRRYINIEVAVREEFRVRDGQAIDISASVNAWEENNSNILDRYIWKMYSTTALSNRDHKKTIISNTTDIYEFFGDLVEVFQNHNERNSRESEMDDFQFIDDLFAMPELVPVEEKLDVEWYYRPKSRFSQFIIDNMSFELIWKHMAVIFLFFQFLAVYTFYTIRYKLVPNRSRLNESRMSWRMLQSHLGPGGRNVWKRFWPNYHYHLFQDSDVWNKYKILFGVLAFSGTLYGLLSYYLGRSKDYTPERGYLKVKDFELKSGTEPAPTRAKDHTRMKYNIISEGYTVPVHHGTPEQLARSIDSNIWKIRVKNPYSDEMGITHLFGIKGSYCVVNTHAIPDKNLFEFDLLHSHFFAASENNARRFVVPASRMVDLGNDMTLLTISHSFKDVYKHIYDGKVSKTHAGYFSGDNILLEFSGSHYVDGIKFDNTIKYNAPYQRGACGQPVIAGIGRSGSAIVAIHAAGNANGVTRMGVLIDKSILANAMQVLSDADYHIEMASAPILKGNFEDPVMKSPFRYEEFHHLTYVGKLEGPVLINQKSNLVETRLAPHLDDLFLDELKFERDEHYAAPPHKPFVDSEGIYRSPFNNSLRKMNKSSDSLDVSILEFTIKQYLSQIVKTLDKLGVREMRPISMMEAINGSPDDEYLRAMNLSTSAGHGRPGKKIDYMEEISEGIYRPVRSVMEEINIILNLLREGECVGVYYDTSTKDEPRLAAKVKTGNTRIFYICPLAWLIVCRMYLAPLYTLMVQFSEAFGTRVGTNIYVQADEFYRKHNNFSSFVIEGDYSGFDVSSPPDIARASATLSYRLLEHYGYNEFALKIVSSILSENLFPWICMNQDVFTKMGIQPSGKYGTAEDNSLRGVLMLMYAYNANPRLRDRPFWEHVQPDVYGDDVVASVHPSVADEFNNNTYQDDCAKYYNMKFTSASKSQEMDRFVSPDTMSFLRRKFVYNPRLERYIAPLNMNSLYKMLQWCMPSQTVSEVTQISQTCNSFLWELYLHTDDEAFFRIRARIIQLLNEEYLIPIPSLENELMTYYGVEQRMFKGSEIEVSVGATDLNCLSSDFVFSLESCLVHFESIEPDEIKVNSHQSVLSPTVSPEISDVKHQWHAENYEEKGQSELSRVDDYLISTNPVINLKNLEKHKISLIPSGYVTNRMRRKRLLDYDADIAHESDVDATIDVLRRQLARTELSFESDSITSTEFDIPTLVDIVGDTPEEVKMDSTIHLNSADADSVDLGDFLSRPVEIVSFDITPGTEVRQVIDVWNIYLSEPSVRSKLKNFAFGRMDLEVMIQISGSPFHFGKMLFSYQPLADSNATILAYESMIATEGYPSCHRIVNGYFSQAPGATVVDVKANKPVVMHIPYIASKPAARFYNNSSLALGASSDFEDFSVMGKLYMHSLNRINSVSATPSTVNVMIYARAINVTLGVPTGTNMEITTESDKIKVDEFETGPVEKYSSNALAISKALEEVPIISPYAKASSVVLGGIHGIASHFGLSRPPTIEDPIYVKNRPFASGAQTIGLSTTERLTLDPKQEVSIDPSVCGVDTDDMAIIAISSRESYLDSVKWNPSDSPLADQVFRCKVHPQLGYTFTSTALNNFFQPTAMAFATAPFRYWHGDITFRFEFVISAYHRGKVAIYYEPNVPQQNLIDGLVDLNKHQITIVDLQQTQDVSVKVRWSRPRAWAYTVPASDTPILYTDFDPSSYADNYANGYIAIVPLTTLQSPDDSSIDINVYVSCDNLKVNQLIEDHMLFSRLEFESDTISPDEVKMVDMLSTADSSSWASIYHFGEQPVSFRSLIKRFAPTGDFLLSPPSADQKGIKVVSQIMPVPNPAYGQSLSSGTINLFAYLRYAYLGYKGSIRKRVMIYHDEVRLMNQYLYCVATVGDADTNNTRSISYINSNIRISVLGSAIYMMDTNAGVEFELPFYSPNLFQIAFADDGDGASDPTDLLTLYTRLYKLEFLFPVTALSNNVIINECSAAGDDFSFLRFQGAPFYSY